MNAVIVNSNNKKKMESISSNIILNNVMQLRYAAKNIPCPDIVSKHFYIHILPAVSKNI